MYDSLTPRASGVRDVINQVWVNSDFAKERSPILIHGKPPINLFNLSYLVRQVRGTRSCIEEGITVSSHGNTSYTGGTSHLADVSVKLNSRHYCELLVLNLGGSYFCKLSPQMLHLLLDVAVVVTLFCEVF